MPSQQIELSAACQGPRVECMHYFTSVFKVHTQEFDTYLAKLHNACKLLTICNIMKQAQSEKWQITLILSTAMFTNGICRPPRRDKAGLKVHCYGPLNVLISKVRRESCMLIISHSQPLATLKVLQYYLRATHNLLWSIQSKPAGIEPTMMQILTTDKPPEPRPILHIDLHSKTWGIQRIIILL